MGRQPGRSLDLSKSNDIMSMSCSTSLHTSAEAKVTLAEVSWREMPKPKALLFGASPDPPQCGSCCPCPLQTAALGGRRPRAPAPDWLCCCPCCAVSGEAIVSSGDCTASGPPLTPRLLGDPARL